jgi:hypothetical protein
MVRGAGEGCSGVPFFTHPGHTDFEEIWQQKCYKCGFLSPLNSASDKDPTAIYGSYKASKGRGHRPLPNTNNCYKGATDPSPNTCKPRKVFDNLFLGAEIVAL